MRINFVLDLIGKLHRLHHFNGQCILVRLDHSLLRQHALLEQRRIHDIIVVLLERARAILRVAYRSDLSIIHLSFVLLHLLGHLATDMALYLIGDVPLDLA